MEIFGRLFLFEWLYFILYFLSEIQVAFIPNSLFDKNGGNGNVSTKLSAHMSSIECKTELNKQCPSIEVKTKEASNEQSNVEKDPWGRPIGLDIFDLKISTTNMFYVYYFTL